jgi:hypothetical protein
MGILIPEAAANSRRIQGSSMEMTELKRINFSTMDIIRENSMGKFTARLWLLKKALQARSSSFLISGS